MIYFYAFMNWVIGFLADNNNSLTAKKWAGQDRTWPNESGTH